MIRIGFHHATEVGNYRLDGKVVLRAARLETQARNCPNQKEHVTKSHSFWNDFLQRMHNCLRFHLVRVLVAAYANANLPEEL